MPVPWSSMARPRAPVEPVLRGNANAPPDEGGAFGRGEPDPCGQRALPGPPAARAPMPPSPPFAASAARARVGAVALAQFGLTLLV